MIVRTEHHFAWEKVDFVIYCRTPIRSIARNLGVMSSDHVLAADIKKALPVSNPEGPCTNFTNNKNIHLLPCKIHHDGQARVSEYFNPQQVDGEGINAKFEASYRGRRLAGKKVNLPEGVTGIVLRQQTGASIGNQQCQSNNFAVADEVFDHFFYWNHDIEPSETDHVPKTLQWFDIAKTLHAPIVDEDVGDVS